MLDDQTKKWIEFELDRDLNFLAFRNSRMGVPKEQALQQAKAQAITTVTTHIHDKTQLDEALALGEQVAIANVDVEYAPQLTTM